MSTDDDHRHVQDNEDYYQRRRLEEIGDARRAAAEKRTQAEALAKDTIARTGDPSKTWQSRSVYRTAVENYIREVEPLLTERFPEEGRHRWTSEPLGTLTVNPPEFLEDEHPTTQLKRRPKPASIEFNGLTSLLETPSPIPITFEATKTYRQGRDEHLTERVTAEPTFGILDRAYRSVNLFLAEIGLEIEVEQQRGPWEV